MVKANHALSNSAQNDTYPRDCRDLKIQRHGRQQERQKTIGLISKTTTSHVHHTFLYISFPFLHNCDVKMQLHKVRNENGRFLVAWLMAQKRRCRASVSTSMNKNNFCSADNGAFTLILFSIQCILEFKTAILSRNLSTVAKKQDPCIFYAWSRFRCWY